MKYSAQIVTAAVLLALVPMSLFGRGLDDFTHDRQSQRAALADPAYCIAEHNVGKIVMAVDNSGHIGDGFSLAGVIDCFTGLEVHACEYPAGSNTHYLWVGALWVGAVVGNDTLVSTGADGWIMGGYEFHPDESPAGDMIYRSNADPLAPEYQGAVSYQDFVAVYYDTCSTCIGVENDPRDGRSHMPLNIEVTQESYAWPYAYAEDFVLFNYTLRNTGQETLNDVYVGIYVDADVYHQATGDNGARDDLTGFHLPVHPAAPPLAWIADNNGDLSGAAVPAATAVCFLDDPTESSSLSYNWWISDGNASFDFGPQPRSGYCEFGTGGSGTPNGDRGKYCLMRTGGIDYDQAMTAQISPLDAVWLTPPPSVASNISSGHDTRYLLSVGPTTLEPGEEASYVTAYVAGDNFHTVIGNGNNLPDNPAVWYDNVDFGDLEYNSAWAGWIYDNPGVDTDGDGYAGDYMSGDGVPDFRGACAPPPPPFWIEPGPGALKVRWNGHACETAHDVFSNEQDFEGYNVYISTSGARGSFLLDATYDLEDYYKYRFVSAGQWVNDGDLYTLEELRCLYAPSGCGDVGWHPLDHPITHPYMLSGFVDSIFYFAPVAQNASEFGVTTPIQKRYPGAPEPPYADPTEVPGDSIDFFLTEDGYFKYYEYEYTIAGLLAGTPYWVSVSVFDCGAVVAGVESLECPVVERAQQSSPEADPGQCCVGDRGNILLQPDCGTSDQTVDIVDLQLMIEHMFLSLAPLCCESEADLDLNGIVDISDLQIMVDHQYLSMTPLPACP